MALPVCTFCEQYEGVYMGTNLQDGDTQVLCGTCLPGYAIGMAAAMTQGMEQHEALQYADALDTIYNNDPRAPKSDRLRPRGKAKATPAAEAEPAAQPDAPLAVPPASDGSAEQALDAARSDAAVQVALVPSCDRCGSTTGTGDAHKLTCNECGTIIATAAEPVPGAGE